MDNYLQETPTFDYSDPVIQGILADLDLNGLSDMEKAEKLFYYVRDNLKYSIRGMSLDPKKLQASHTLQQQHSFCIPKAIALATLARGVGIPSRIHMVDFINHRLAPGLADLWGTNIMAPHSFAELYLNNQWIKLTPALDRFTCDEHDFVIPEFKPGEHTMLHPVDRKGNPHVEYIRDHGTFDDLPIKRIMEILEDVYGNPSQDLLNKIFIDDIPTFE